MLSDKLMDRLMHLRKFTTWSEEGDFNPMELSGSNFDDAYWNGFNDGKIDLAKEILKELEGQATMDWHEHIEEQHRKITELQRIIKKLLERKEN